MTYPEALRAYANWMEDNLGLNIGKGSITLYNNDKAAVDLLKSGLGEVDDPGLQYNIVYVNLNQFGPLRVQLVVKKSVLMEPSIKDGEVVWVMKNEFTALGAF